jgi:hypothetical protein
LKGAWRFSGIEERLHVRWCIGRSFAAFEHEEGGLNEDYEAMMNGCSTLGVDNPNKYEMK